MLHADADFPIAVESPVEAHNIWGVALMEHLQLPNDLVPDGWFNLKVDQLEHSRAHVFNYASVTQRRQMLDNTSTDKNMLYDQK